MKLVGAALFPKIDTAALFPKIDTAALLPKIDTAALFPKIDTAALLPKIDYNALFPKIDTAALFPKIDTAALLPKIDYNALFPRTDFTKLREWVRELRREWWPPNWPTDIPDLEVVNTILNDDGIPLVWVPRAEIVDQLLAAPSREARVAVLMVNQEMLLDDCRKVAEDLDHPRIRGSAPLAEAAIAALNDRHYEAGQALAVVVTESALKAALAKSYSKIHDEVKLDAREVALRALRHRAALAPVGPFYTPYWPSTDESPPLALSRHVSVHYADADHYTDENALLAVMLMASVLRALDDYWHRVEPGDGPEPPITL